MPVVWLKGGNSVRRQGNPGRGCLLIRNLVVLLIVIFMIMLVFNLVHLSQFDEVPHLHPQDTHAYSPPPHLAIPEKDQHKPNPPSRPPIQTPAATGNSNRWWSTTPKELQCPAWTTAIEIEQQRSWDFSRNCKSLDEQRDPSSDTSRDFSVSLCQSIKVCGEGYVLVKRIDSNKCQKGLSTEFTWSPDTRKWIHKHFGPDSFLFYMQGQDQYIGGEANIHHMGNCAYKFPFRLLNPYGTFNLTLIHSFQNYDAFNEFGFNASTAEDTQRKHVIRTTDISFECPHCKPYTPSSVDAMKDVLPLCPRHKSATGAWIRMTGETPTEKARLKNNQGIPFTWRPLGCRYDQTFDTAEGVDDSCLSRGQTRMVLMGDSQTRFSFDALDARIAGYNGMLHTIKAMKKRNEYRPGFKKVSLTEKVRMALNMTGDMEEPDSELDIQFDFTVYPYFNMTNKEAVPIKGVQLMYLFEPHLDKFGKYHNDNKYNSTTGLNSIETELNEFDVIFIQMAHWPLSGKPWGGEWTLERLRGRLIQTLEVAKTINDKLTRIYRVRDRPLRIIWQGVHAVLMGQFHRFGEPLRLYPWKNPHRLLAWSMLAEHTIKESQSVSAGEGDESGDGLGMMPLGGRGMRVTQTRVEVLNAFGFSSPWERHAFDDGHYHRTPAVDALTDETLHRLNLCKI